MLKSSRNFCFTDFELRDWRAFFELGDRIRYIGWGLETCPSTGKKHYQGWIQFSREHSLKRAICYLNVFWANKGKDTVHSTHVEMCRGTEEHNVTYCSKENYEYVGKFVTQGQRIDLENLYEQVHNGLSLQGAALSNPVLYCKYRQGFRDIAQMAIKDRASTFREIETTVHWGPTDTGKTRSALEQYPDAYKIEGDELTWFDGYEGQKELIIDEYDSQIKLTRLLNLLDGYRLRLPIKGGFTYAEWNRIIITSNVDPQEWHPHAKEEHRYALMRRIHKIVHFAPGAFFPPREDVKAFASSCL